ncbi:MAG: hypothetical protein QMD36_04670 [Candidatus Aenigmarchaeota archaeon]|nr:hypothetical protein [Candidatus Aenigmarchaeota archaeon]
MLNNTNNHYVRIRRSVCEEYHDLLMTLMELGPTRLKKASEKCNLNADTLKRLAKMGKALNHIKFEDKRGTTYEITDWGIDALNTWITIQRLGLKGTVTSKYDIDSEPFNKMGIGFKKPYLSGKKTHEIYNYSRVKPCRSYFFVSVDVLRVLRKHYPKSIPLNRLIYEANIPPSCLLSGLTYKYKEMLGYLSEKELLSVSEKGRTLLCEGNKKGNTAVNAVDGYAKEHGLEPIIPTHVRPKGWTGHYLREVDQIAF